jgi:hypothetical protein
MAENAAIIAILHWKRPRRISERMSRTAGTSQHQVLRQSFPRPRIRIAFTPSPRGSGRRIPMPIGRQRARPRGSCLVAAAPLGIAHGPPAKEEHQPSQQQCREQDEPNFHCRLTLNLILSYASQLRIHNVP